MKLKIYEDKEKLIESELTRTKDIMSKMLDRLPNEELPFMEPHLRALYFETYFLVAEGFYNASLISMGILLESIIKEKLFIEGVSDEQLEKMNFGKIIKKCEEMRILEEELGFLKNRKDHLRNPYAHFNHKKISEGIYFPVWKIPSEEVVLKLISLDKKVREGKLTETEARQELIKGIEPEMMSSKELRPMSIMAKNIKEKSQIVDVFLEIDKFVRDFAGKYFKPEDDLKKA